MMVIMVEILAIFLLTSSLLTARVYGEMAIHVFCMIVNRMEFQFGRFVVYIQCKHA